MIPREVLQKIRRIQITTSRMVTDVFAGQYKSVFKGKGMEFQEVREYQPGDDIRCIDWNVTARLGHPYVKKFVEERELSVMFLVDASLSTYFGTTEKLKSQIAAEICSLLAFSAIKNNDKVGLLIFTDRIEKFVPPRKGLKHILRIIREVIYFKPQGRGTDIPIALEYLNKICRRKSVAFIISDFLGGDFKKALSIANKKHDIVAISVTDPREKQLAAAGVVEFADAETGEVFFIDTHDRRTQAQFNKRSSQILDKRKKTFASIGVDNIDIESSKPYVSELVKFFRMREKRMI
ncbi:MAG: DUF58 domain-containing protein [Candidatus Omnitrophota bacterium]|nr:MAG: DUF58 domain-containing protein [Candidatus Omnitrophota bacterium]